MSVRQPKSQSTTVIEVTGRPGVKKGRLELTSGNITYFRPGAKAETLSLTYQQLLAVLEWHKEYDAIDTKKSKLPKSRQAGDFSILVNAVNDEGEWEFILGARSSINKIDPRRVDLGTYQFSDDMASGRPSKKYQWFAHVSIQAALWIINSYIDKFLVAKKMSNFTDENIVVSKQEMRSTLMMLCKKIAP